MVHMRVRRDATDRRERIPLARASFAESCLRQKWNEAPGVARRGRLFAPDGGIPVERSTYKLFYELAMTQSAAHFFIISLT